MLRRRIALGTIALAACLSALGFAGAVPVAPGGDGPPEGRALISGVDSHLAAVTHHRAPPRRTPTRLVGLVTLAAGVVLALRLAASPLAHGRSADGLTHPVSPSAPRAPPVLLPS